MKRIFLFALTAALFAGCSDTSKTTEKEAEEAAPNDKTVVKPPVVDVKAIASMNDEELRLARNTIYAKYGRVFTTDDLKSYFSKQPWYKENPRYTDKDLKEEDKKIIQLIHHWETKTSVLWREKADLDGDGNYDDCYVLMDDKNAKFTVVINDYSRVFKHNWGNTSNEKPPSEWVPVHVQLVDIDPSDGRQEIHVHQRYADWVDPGTENYIFTYDGEVRLTELSSDGYDAGEITFNNKGTATMLVSNCPVHTRDYQLKEGKLAKSGEKISPEPPGGCAACFSGDANVATSITSSMKISELKKGDAILSYDIPTGQLFTTKVARVLSVYHENIVLLSFGKQTLEVTNDHPFYVANKGWCSLQPEKTMERYENYGQVQRLELGDALQMAEGSQVKITSIETLVGGKMTYTVSSLEEGNTFIVNGAVVGTETVSSPRKVAAL